MAGPCAAGFLPGPRTFSPALTSAPSAVLPGLYLPRAGLTIAPAPCVWVPYQLLSPASPNPSWWQSCPHALPTDPCNMVLTANLMKLHPATLSTLSVVRILNRTGPSNDPWGPSLLPASRQHMTHYPPASEACHATRYSPMWLSTHPGCNISAWIQEYCGNRVVSIAKVKTNYILYSSLIHSSSHSITQETQQVTHDLPLGSPCWLSTVIPSSPSCAQKSAFKRTFPSLGEADCSVIPQCPFNLSWR